jgi:photosystem II stability/assembly factor-like uncharacterized protein
MDIRATKGSHTTPESKPGNGSASLLAWPWLIAAVLLLLAATALAWWQDPLPVPPNRGAQGWSFWKPMEVNAHRRLAAVGVDLRGVSLNPDGLRGWAVGTDGAILATTDGGKTWAAQTSGTANALNALSFHADGLRGWAVGASGAILATTDGGKSWTVQPSGTTSTLFALSFHINGLRGWAVGDGGAIIATTDGGKTWSAQTNATANSLRGVSFHADGMLGWAVGGSGTILATTDGGKTWVGQTSGTAADLTVLSFYTDGLRGWAGGGGGTMLATTDGGKTWAVRTRVTTWPSALSFHADGLRGWAVGNVGVIVATTDGGKTWATQTSDTTGVLFALSFHADGRRGWAVGAGGVILATNDGGQTWTTQTSRTTGALFALSFHADGRRGWAVGDGGAILASNDGGKKWATQASGTTKLLRALRFHADGLRGWAVGSDGAILATTNGGRTWEAQVSGTIDNLTALCFHADGLRGWAVGDSGSILATTDGGKTWAAQNSGTTNSLRGLSFHADGLRGWAVGTGGTIVATSDGGKTWLRINGGQSGLGAVSFHTDGLRGWVVEDGRGWGASFIGGTILATTDGGKTWASQNSGIDQWLYAISFHGDGLRGQAVGDEGAIVATINGGKTWVPQASGIKQKLYSVSLHADGLRGWATGDAGTIIATTDGGTTWQSAEPYTRYPAPWYALAVLLAAALAWLSWSQRPTGTAGESVADMAASDAEVRQPADDRLEFGGLARGISRFLRNTETRPPLTLAITGDWGSGKSSLMRLVCADMKRFGHQAIWFNAWHHQKQEHLFAALLGAVKAQAVPRLLSLKSVQFRLRLLWLRSRRNFAISLLAVTAIATLAGLSLQVGGTNWFAQLTSPFVAPKAGSLTTALDWAWLHHVPLIGQWLATLAALLTTAWTLFKATKPFGINPSVLLAEVRDGMSLKTAAAQNDFRAQFAREFQELIQALPNRLVIVIDDLDRCHHAAVLEVMEAVNYLTSAGECFVMFGMATERVQAALGLAFKDIAGEMQKMEVQQALRSADEAAPISPPPDAALVKRRDYAADYLQKLVNIEIKVPTREHAQAHQLLIAPEPAPRRAVLGVLQGLWRLWPVAALVTAVCVGAALSGVLSGMVTKQASVMDVKAVVPVTTGTTTVAPAQPASGAIVKPEPPQPQTQPSLEPGASVSWTAMLAWLLVALIPIAVVSGFIMMRLLRSSLQETRDSPQFREALAIWTGVVSAKRSTPRAIKRFGNRIRYLAMLQQGQEKDETQWDVLRATVGKWFGKKTEHIALDMPKPGALKEHQLIAMGAVHEVWGLRWREALSAEFVEDYQVRKALSSARDADEFDPEDLYLPSLVDAVKAHAEQFGAIYPPSTEEQEVFDRLLSGVRLGGDPQIIEPSVATIEDSGSSPNVRKAPIRKKRPSSSSAA